MKKTLKVLTTLYIITLCCIMLAFAIFCIRTFSTTLINENKNILDIQIR